MKKNAAILFVMFVFICQAIAQMPVKKYDIKSGIVSYDQIMKVGELEIKKKILIYFDDYGMKECRETYSGDKLEESYFSDGKELFSVKPSKKIAHKQGPAYRGIGLCADWREFGTEKDRQSGKIKIKPAMSVAGKSCETFETNDGKGSVCIYAGWNKILMYMSVKTKSVETLQKATKIDENAKVPAEKFKVPAGYNVQ